MAIVQNIISELKQNVDKKYKEGAERYFKEGIVLYGVRTPKAREIEKKHWNKISDKSKENIFKICNKLLKDGKQETHGIAVRFIHKIKKQYTQNDFTFFENWIEKYVNNWGRCDNLCCGPLGEFLLQYPEMLPSVFSWTGSNNRWMKRASAVSLIVSLRKGKYLKNALKTADALLIDEDDMVQKGYGWMLKEATRHYEKEVFTYVMKNKRETTPLGVHTRKMPRTALRYAIEKMPAVIKKKAMG